MKNIFKSLCAGFICLMCLISAVGCSCSKKSVKINYNIEVYAADGKDSAITERITVEANLIKKFAEPAGTPCYKRGETEYKKLTSETQLNECNELGCYSKKEDGEYAKLDNKQDILMAALANGNCYAKVYKYEIINDSNSEKYETSCYTSTGEKFERLTPNSSRKEASVELEHKFPIYTGQKNINLMYTSETRDMPKKETESFIYEFVIYNQDTNDIYIEIIGIGKILNDQLSLNARKTKFKYEEPTNDVDLAKRAYIVKAGKTMKLKIEVKNLTKSDLVNDETDTLTLRIPLKIVK